MPSIQLEPLFVIEYKPQHKLTIEHDPWHKAVFIAVDFEGDCDRYYNYYGYIKHGFKCIDLENDTSLCNRRSTTGLSDDLGFSSD